MRPFPVLMLFFLLAARLDARHAFPGPHWLECQARGNDVLLTWDTLGMDPNSHEARVLRDGQQVAILQAQDVSFRDAAAGLGKHAYELNIHLRSDDGSDKLLSSSTCTAEVLFPNGIRCEVLGGIAIPPQAVLSWDPIPAELSIGHLTVERDGEAAGELPPEATGFMDPFFAGESTYTVAAHSSLIPIAAEPILPIPPLVIGDCKLTFVPPKIGGFVRADANADDKHDLSDAIFTLNYLFQGGGSPTCLKSADANDSGEVDLSDAVYTIGFLFLGSSPPPAPFPQCDEDPTEDALSCDAYGPCFHPPPP